MSDVVFLRFNVQTQRAKPNNALTGPINGNHVILNTMADEEFGLSWCGSN